MGASPANIESPRTGVRRQISRRRIVQGLLDTTVLATAFGFSYLLRFDFELSPWDARRLWPQMVFVVALQLAAMRFFGIDCFVWRFVSLREARKIVMTIGVVTLALFVLRLLLPFVSDLLTVPFSIAVLDFGLASAGLVAVRILRRELHEWNHRAGTSDYSERKPIILVGAGQAGVLTLAEILRRGDIGVEVLGFVDDDHGKHGAVINGVRVLGAIDDLPRLVPELGVDHVIISIAQANREQYQRILHVCRSVPVRARTIPGLYELLQGRISVSRIRDIEIQDLLGREPVTLEAESIDRFLSEKVVMVTGAGGSIGSELARQLGRCGVGELLLVERSEYALFQIERELAESYPDLRYRALMADVCDERRMRKIFATHRPEVVFHAAAHKHVPMMEENASEAVKNNVFGTRRTAELAGEFGAGSFVLVSTDKAVRPRSVMGATKRAAELIIQEFDRRYETKYLAVRFGNVIGSNGSVIPTFRDQIMKGGPVTVTHPDMERFFMTIPEATQLVMQAGAYGCGGEIFILDMGAPVKILDLAKETIRLSGLEPDVDIKIAFTGVRPGEKMIEELESDAERLSRTAHPKIFIGTIAQFSSAQVSEMLDAFADLCDDADPETVRRTLTTYLPDALIGIPDVAADVAGGPSSQEESAVGYRPALATNG